MKYGQLHTQIQISKAISFNYPFKALNDYKNEIIEISTTYIHYT